MDKQTLIRAVQKAFIGDTNLLCALFDGYPGLLKVPACLNQYTENFECCGPGERTAHNDASGDHLFLYNVSRLQDCWLLEFHDEQWISQDREPVNAYFDQFVRQYNLREDLDLAGN